MNKIYKQGCQARVSGLISVLVNRCELIKFMAEPYTVGNISNSVREGILIITIKKEQLFNYKYKLS